MTSVSAGEQEAAGRDWTTRFAGETREVYRRALLDLASQDRRIYCLDSDQGGWEESFARQLPEQYVNLGIAEANLMSVAAGLAAAGKIPFVNTMAGFATARAYEQIKIDIAYNNLPVKIVGTHGGLAGGHFGPTHQAQEDLALMRVLPNVTVLVPADAVETLYCVQAALRIPGPVYIRLGRRATALVYPAAYDFQVGRAVTLRAGDDLTIVACGPPPVLMALAAHELLAARGIAARVLNVHTLKPLDRAALLSAASQTRGLITVEEHSMLAGVGGAVAELICEQACVPVRRLGLPDAFCERVGTQQELLAACDLTSERIVEEALRLLCGSAKRQIV
ncbi:MAG TPA: transketolase C-terminal domain-containing protein [Ktedonobacteraceae bacterium]|jgi:transketolase